MAERDRPAVRVDPRVVVGDAVVVEERQHLHRERLVELEQSDVLNGQSGRAQRLPGRRDRADAHHLGFDAGEAVADQRHLGRQPQLGRDVGAGDQAGGRAVVEAGRVAGGDPPVRPERRLQPGQRLDRGARPRRLVPGRQPPAVLGRPRRHRHQVRLHLAVRVRLGELLLRGRGERVGPLSGQGREPVVQVFRGAAHDHGRGVDQLVRDQPRVGVDALAHRVVAHVLDPAGDRHVVRAERDAGGDRGDRGHRAGAHPVDREARHARRQAGQDGRVAADGQALVAGLGGGRDRDLVDPLRRQPGVAPQQLADHGDDHVVGSGLRVHPLGPALPNGVRAPSTNTTSLSERVMPPL